jgi:hypothetical protein
MAALARTGERLADAGLGQRLGLGLPTDGNTSAAPFVGRSLVEVGRQFADRLGQRRRSSRRWRR